MALQDLHKSLQLCKEICYNQFCMKACTTPLPASEYLLCQFVSFLANENLSHSTIKCYLAGVRHLHIAEGFGDPRIRGMARLEQALKGIKSTQAKKRGPNRQTRLPITLGILSKLRRACQRAESGKCCGLQHPRASLAS